MYLPLIFCCVFLLQENEIIKRMFCVYICVPHFHYSLSWNSVVVAEDPGGAEVGGVGFTDVGEANKTGEEGGRIFGTTHVVSTHS